VPPSRLRHPQRREHDPADGVGEVGLPDSD
jgi:hypothetical protein